jgi:hypothetical protein
MMITHQFNWPTSVVWAVMDALEEHTKRVPLAGNDRSRLEAAIADLRAADGEYEHIKGMETAYGHTQGW